jgi:hypothetical protein
MGNFPLALKSTLDKLLVDLATANGYDAFDLDGSYMVPEKTESESPAIVWSIPSPSPMPRDPFYHLQFEVGARTANDESQYLGMKITSLLGQVLAVGESFYVMDYSTLVAPTVTLGDIFITSNIPTPPEFDRISSIRAIQITAAVQRYPV